MKDLFIKGGFSMPIGSSDSIIVREFDTIYKHALNVGDIGICKWNLDKDEMYIAEKITGHDLDSVKNMKEMLSIIAYPKDRDLALRDLEDYINRDTIYYQSSFRIRTKSGEIKWILCRGKIFKDIVTKDNVLHVLMFNVTGTKLHEGHDILTNLINDRFFIRKLKNSIKTAKAQNRRGALIYIDIDNFGSVVNNFGFHFGDEVLIGFSQTVDSLIDKDHELAKFPGDKFIILIHNFNNIKEVEEICNRIYERFKSPLLIMDNQININLSLGVTIFPDDSDDADELLKYCNFAISQSKQSGKNICTFFDKQVSESYYRKILIESELLNAIVKDELYLNYQPKIDISSNRVKSVEVLLRWRNGKIGNISPIEFIPIAESKGHIVKIGNWVLEEALRTANEWKEKGYKLEAICVNISPMQLKRKDFKANLLDLCNKYNYPPSKLELEITEGTLMEACQDNVNIIDELIETGFQIAIDDFGTGYSNLNTLIQFKLSTLKVDKSIIDHIENDKNRYVFESILTLAKNLGFKVIAEGVETKEQFDILTKLGCNRVQGYYFSKPLPKNEIELLLDKYSR